MKENLKKAVTKRKGKTITMLSDSFLIRHKPSKIEYTIKKVVFENGEPLIIAYRYYSKPNKDKKVFIKIPMKEFNDYEAV
jgi:hypothetical protein